MYTIVYHIHFLEFEVIFAEVWIYENTLRQYNGLHPVENININFVTWAFPTCQLCQSLDFFNDPLHLQ